LRTYPSFSDPLIRAAYQELEKFESWAVSERSRFVILDVLLHGEPDVVRTLLFPLGSAGIRYELLKALYGTHGDERDLARLRLFVPDESSPDVVEMAAQINLLELNVAKGLRSKLESRIMTSKYRTRTLAQSDARLKFFRALRGPDTFLIHEYCLRISLGDASVIGAVRKLAGTDVELRDQITTAIAKGHAHSGSPIRARGALEYVMMPAHRIEVLVLIACVESEFGVEPTLDVH